MEENEKNEKTFFTTRSNLFLFLAYFIILKFLIVEKLKKQNCLTA
jgi:hypothetical protein